MSIKKKKKNATSAQIMIYIIQYKFSNMQTLKFNNQKTKSNIRTNKKC